MKLSPFACIALLALAACADPTGPASVAAPGLLRYAGADARVVVPDTVPRGVPFTVSVQTFAGGCTREAAPAEVRAAPGRVRVAVFNRTRRDAACTDDLLTLDHAVTLSLDAPGAVTGAVTIEIRGANRGAETDWQTVPWLVQRVVVVR